MEIAQDWIGVDEVGRGCLAGPVVAAAVAWTEAAPPAWAAELQDSKQLSKRRRSELAMRLLGDAGVRWQLAWSEPAQIDRDNILQASLDAMRRAVDGLELEVPGAYVDGNRPFPGPYRQQTIPGGDRRIPQIAAASIIAKVFRDRWMACLDERYPGYGWAENKGYGTSAHLRALQRHGPTPLHRRSFQPVAQRTLFGADELGA